MHYWAITHSIVVPSECDAFAYISLHSKVAVPLKHILPFGGIIIKYLAGLSAVKEIRAFFTAPVFLIYKNLQSFDAPVYLCPLVVKERSPLQGLTSSSHLLPVISAASSKSSHLALE